MKIDDLNNVIYNPYFTSKLLFYFLNGACSSNIKGLKFELFYIALPLFYDDIIVEKLNKSNRKTSINTLFDTPELKNKVGDFYKIVESFNKVTNLAIIFLANQNNLKIESFTKIEKTINYQLEKNEVFKKYAKAAFNLGFIIGKEDYKNVIIRLNL
jgi:hypothetical protein